MGLWDMINTPTIDAPSRTDESFEPSDVLKDVLKDYKGLAKQHNLTNTKVVYATPERTKLMNSKGIKGGLEYWPKEETGIDDYTHPDENKSNVLEIHDSKLKKNRKELYNAIYGDLMHGMDEDPTWNKLRKHYKANYTPEELDRQKKHTTWLDDVNSQDAENAAPNSGHDAYIRHYLNEYDTAMKGQKTYDNTMYSPAQIKDLEQMKQYLKEGTYEKVSED